MKKSKSLLLAIFSIVVASILFAALPVHAATESRVLGIVPNRTSNHTYSMGGKTVFKIATYDNMSDTTPDTISELFYCEFGGVGFGSTSNSVIKQTYYNYGDFKDLSTIDSAYKRNFHVLEGGPNYHSALWVIDNMFTNLYKSNNTAQKEVFFAKVDAYLNAHAGELNTVLLDKIDYSKVTDEDIDVIQQCALWYFTNAVNGTEYHYNSLASLYIDSNSINDSGRLNAIEGIYQYFRMNGTANTDYTSRPTNTGKPVTLDTSRATMTEQLAGGRNYVMVGPISITKNYDFDTLKLEGFMAGEGSLAGSTYATKRADGTFERITTTLAEFVNAHSGEDFYCIYQLDSASSRIDTITYKLNLTFNSKTVSYWNVANPDATRDQPVIKIVEEPKTTQDTFVVKREKKFDLALRKFITKINDREITNRVPDPDVSLLANKTATTANYNHTKAPLTVAIGDVVTYTIRVYNEGEVNGYANQITDHLPANLEFINDAENAAEGWKLGSDLKTVTTDKLSKAKETTSGSNMIQAFAGSTTSKLDYKEVKIKCKVVSTNPLPEKITNIAEITNYGYYNDSNQYVEAKTTGVDRDSIENNLNLPTGSALETYNDAAINRGDSYIPGQQDDDDFEKLTLKNFDIALRKYITSINGDTSLGRGEPEVITTALANGTATTATYNHSKVPLSVAINDTIVYTIRVYNEGETDGYAGEIKDYLPAQLQFVEGSTINTKYGWVKESDNVYKTSYLSYEKGTDNLLTAYKGGSTLSNAYVQMECKVVHTDNMPAKLTNLSEISKYQDRDGQEIKDRDSEQNNIQLPSDRPGYKDDEINKPYVPGQQDDDDFEKVKLKEFDLALRKSIVKIDDEEITNRLPDADFTNLKAGTDTTATYNHTKRPLKVDIGSTVVYELRVYNEGDVDGYAAEVTDYLPAQLKLKENSTVNTNYRWQADTTDSQKIKTDYLSRDTSVDNLLKAFNGSKLDYKSILVECVVVETENMPEKITNIAEISKSTDVNGDDIVDRDSQTNNVRIPEDRPGYKDDEINKEYVPGQQDDDDFEKVILRKKEFDLALRKFITKVNDEAITTRIPDVDVTDLKSGADTTATYNHSKKPVSVAIGDTIEYTLRVYNEGDMDGYAQEIMDNLPDQLEFLPENATNKKYGWKQDTDNKQVIRTTYLSKEEEKTAGENLLKAYDGGDTLSYKEVKVACKVVETDPMPSKITNIAEITKNGDENGTSIKDRDSDTDNVTIPEDRPSYKDDESDKDYVPGQEDDDDFEKVEIKEFDLALRKFITKVNESDVTSRIPEVDVTKLKDGSSTTAEYNHPKDPVLVSTNAIVEYTIRVFNEGQVNGYANLIKDDIPEGLEFIPTNKTNLKYRWVMLDKDGNETSDVSKAEFVVTDYLSKDQEKTAGENLLKAYDGGDTLNYKDVVIAFKVIEPKTSDRIIINQAQISDDSDEDGNSVKDRDSTPDEWKGEDDEDIEKLKVTYFDLALRKWVTQAIVIENGKTTVTETGHHAEDDPEEIVKVDLKNSKINDVTVKFKYSIRVTNEGKIAGYAKEVKDYIPEGLKFVQADNPQWKDNGNNEVVTDALKDILLEPGESAEVTIILTWINGKDNMGLKDNWAEISKDYNEFNEPDRDSTPNNNRKGEDDIDDAPVLLQIKTGEERTYFGIAAVVLVIIGSGITLIKKYVL